MGETIVALRRSSSDWDRLRFELLHLCLGLANGGLGHAQIHDCLLLPVHRHLIILFGFVAGHLRRSAVLSEHLMRPGPYLFSRTEHSGPAASHFIAFIIRLRALELCFGYRKRGLGLPQLGK